MHQGNQCVQEGGEGKGGTQAWSQGFDKACSCFLKKTLVFEEAFGVFKK